jgi:hypothetical protein
MLIVYTRLTKKELKASVKKTILDIEDWFKNSPKRKTCNVELWYGNVQKIRRGHVKEDVEAVAAKTETK